MRLFLGVDPDAPARAALSAEIGRWRADLGEYGDALRWSAADQWHCTLHFLGEVEGPRLGVLVDALGAPLTPPAFRVATGGLGVFPPSGPPRVLRLGIGEGAAPLVQIHDALAQRLRTATFAVEERPYSPHITVARMRERARSGARGLARAAAALDATPVRWTVTRVTLFSSDLSGRSPRYAAVAHIPLAIE